MGLHSHANTRDANEAEIVQALQKCGASVWRIDSPCDLIVGVRRKGEKRTVLLEVKTERGRTTPAQRYFEEHFKGEYYIVHSVDEAVEAVFGPSAIFSKGCRWATTPRCS